MRQASLAAGLAAIISVCVTAVIMTISANADGVIALARSAARGWLIGIGAGVQVGEVEITMIPLGAVMLAIAVVAWATRALLTEPSSQPVTHILMTGSF